MWELAGVRKRIKKELSKSYRIYFNHSKAILTKMEKTKRGTTTAIIGEARLLVELSTAHFLKEHLYKILNDKNEERAKFNLKCWREEVKE